MTSNLRSRRLWLAAAFAAGTLIVSGPQIAIAAFDAINADKVDGRHAVGAATAKADRAGKLVATNAAGVLPNNIIVKAPNADRLDGLDSTDLQRRITGTCAAGSMVSAVAADGSVTCAPDVIDGGDAQTLDGVDGAGYQTRVTGECTAGTFATAVTAEGGLTCAADLIDGGNADTVDGVDAADLQPKATRTVLVGPVGTALDNGAALVAAHAAIPTTGEGAVSTSNPWLLKLEPGTYQLTGRLALKSGVDLEGSGARTAITCACATVNNTVVSASVTALPGANIRSLAIRNTGGGDYGIGLAVETPATVTDVTAEASGAALLSRGIVLVGPGTGTVRRGSASASGSPSATAMLAQSFQSSIRDIDLTATGTTSSIGLALLGPGSVNANQIRRIAAIVQGGSDVNTVIQVRQFGTTRVDQSTLSATGTNAASIDAIEQRTVWVSSTRLAAPILGAAIWACVGAFDGNYVELTSTCTPPAPPPP